MLSQARICGSLAGAPDAFYVVRPLRPGAATWISGGKALRNSSWLSDQLVPRAAGVILVGKLTACDSRSLRRGKVLEKEWLYR